MPVVHFIRHKRLGLLVSLIFAAFFLLTTAFGAEPLVRIWQTEQGLPQNRVRCILQTKDGYLWIGTEHGLARFDGVHFLSFNSANTPQFKSDHISALAEDEAGNLWIGSRGGGVVRLGKTGFENFSTLNGFSSDMVNCLVADDKGGIWIGTVYGLNHLKDGKLSSKFSKDGLPGTDIKALSRDANGTIWIGTDRGMASFRNDVFQRISSGQFPVDALVIDPHGDVWMGGKAYGLLRSRGGSESFQQMLPLGQVVALAASKNGEVWAALNDGGLRRFQNGKPVPVASPQIEGGVHCLYEDREKNLWIGLDGGGLARMSARPFEIFTIKESSRTDTISTLEQDRDGRIWAAGSSGGLALFQKDTFKSVDLGNRFPSRTPVLTLCGSADGSLWIGTRGDGLFRWQNGNVTVPKADGGSAAVITALLEDRNGALWIGTEAEGILRFKDQKFTRFTKRDGFSRDQANCIVQQADGSIWFGTTSAGVNRWKDGRVTSISEKDGLASDAIHALYADTNGMVWIGTSAGLTLFREDQFFVFKSAHELPGEIISQIVEDDSGNFWLGSNRGLLRVSRQDLLEVADGKKSQTTVVRFGAADGLPSSECIGGRQNSTLKDASGRLWFSTLRGLVRLDALPDKSTSVPQVFVERVLLNDDEVVSDLRLPGKNHSRVETIQVPGGGAKLEIHFAATSLRSPEKALFRYKMEGFDPQWVQVGDARTAIYTKMPKGNYTFRVAAFSDEGIWGEQNASVKIVVLPQYWETVWFKAGIPVVLASAFFGVVYLRRLRQREVEQLRLRIAGDLHDELGSNLSSIALLSGRVGRQSVFGTRERNELNEIGQIARQTIDAVREIVWFINPACDSLDEMLQRMKEVSTQMLSEMRHQFVAPENLGTEKVSPELRRNLLLAFKETLHNVVTHSAATEVEITVNVSNGSWSILVRDNGKGFDTSINQKGNGLKNIRLRLAQLHGAAEITSAPGQGTKIRLEAKFK